MVRKDGAHQEQTLEQVDWQEIVVAYFHNVLIDRHEPCLHLESELISYVFIGS